MEKTFGAMVRQQRTSKGYSLREFSRRLGVSPNFVSSMERGLFSPPSEEKIVLTAEELGQDKDEMLALAGKVSSNQVFNSSYFGDADIRVYDSDAAPEDWGNLDVVGRKGDHLAIAEGMAEDLEALQDRTKLHGDGYDCGKELVWVREEYPSTAAELVEVIEGEGIFKNIGLFWLRRLLRRGRKYRMKVFAVAQEFEVNAWKIAGEGGLRRAFTVLYLGSTAYQALFLIKDKAYREQLRIFFDSVSHPCLVDVKGRFYPAKIPDLSGLLLESRQGVAQNLFSLESK